jgi:hypothetical protein
MNSVVFTHTRTSVSISSTYAPCYITSQRLNLPNKIKSQTPQAFGEKLKSYSPTNTKAVYSPRAKEKKALHF